VNVETASGNHEDGIHRRSLPHLCDERNICRIMSNKSEKTLGWGEAKAILVTLCLVLAPGVNFAESHLVRLFGYWLAKRHIEHLMAAIVKTLDTKCFNLFRERAFHRAVSEMLTELPDFSVRRKLSVHMLPIP